MEALHKRVHSLDEAGLRRQERGEVCGRHGIGGCGGLSGGLGGRFGYGFRGRGVKDDGREIGRGRDRLTDRGWGDRCERLGINRIGIKLFSCVGIRLGFAFLGGFGGRKMAEQSTGGGFGIGFGLCEARRPKSAGRNGGLLCGVAAPARAIQLDELPVQYEILT